MTEERLAELLREADHTNWTAAELAAKLYPSLAAPAGDAAGDELAMREACAKIVEGWHINKGGYLNLAEAIRALPLPSLLGRAGDAASKRLLHGHGFKKGDHVRILSCLARLDHEGKTGRVCEMPAIGKNPVLRVKLDGGTDENWTIIDGTTEKFERLDPPNYEQ